MENKKKLTQRVGHVIAALARKSAIIEANTACPCLHYQPKESKQVKTLRKF